MSDTGSPSFDAAIREIARLSARNAELVERLRTSPGFREGLEAAAKVCKEEAEASYDNGGFNAFTRAAERILALTPSATGKGDIP